MFFVQIREGDGFRGRRREGGKRERGMMRCTYGSFYDPNFRFHCQDRDKSRMKERERERVCV